MREDGKWSPRYTKQEREKIKEIEEIGSGRKYRKRQKGREV